ALPLSLRLPASRHLRSSFVRDQRSHGVERREVDVGVDLNLLVERRVALADVRDDADRNASREEGWGLLRLLACSDDDVALVAVRLLAHEVRSEERRVGKEWRCGWMPEP